MSKLDREFKHEVDTEIRENTYVAKKIITRVLIGILLMCIFGGIGGVVYTKTIGKAQKNAQREVFKEGVAYTEQAASYLAKSYKEYNATEDKTEKRAIMEYVIIKYPNLDVNNIDNAKLKSFYEKCMEN